MLIIGRRRFIGVLAGALAAPLIVRARNIMPVRVIREQWTLFGYDAYGAPVTEIINIPVTGGVVETAGYFAGVTSWFKGDIDSHRPPLIGEMFAHTPLNSPPTGNSLARQLNDSERRQTFIIGDAGPVVKRIPNDWEVVHFAPEIPPWEELAARAAAKDAPYHATVARLAARGIV